MRGQIAKERATLPNSPQERTTTFYAPNGRPLRTAEVAPKEPVWARTTVSEPPSAIDRLLAEARAGLDRVAPEDLEAELAAGALVVDIRPASNREQEGALPGAVVIERIHLEWRLDPTSPDRIDEASPGRRVVVVCNEGYSSSLAARTLRDLGVNRATDLVGGYRAWRALGSGAPH
jgi:rhodanese-related sulfurtransferase